MMPHDKYVGMLLFIPLDSTTLNSDHEMKRILVFRRLYVRACAREREDHMSCFYASFNESDMKAQAKQSIS
jgi:hypothetical protein